MPRDTTATKKFCNSHGDTPVDTQDQDLSATVQLKQHRSSQPSETSPSRTIPSSQNTYNHIKQYITRPLSAKYNTGPPPLLLTPLLLPKAITSRPQHLESSKQWPALLPTSSPLKVTNHSKQQTATTCTITHVQPLHNSSLPWSSHQVTSLYTAIPVSHHIDIN